MDYEVIVRAKVDLPTADINEAKKMLNEFSDSDILSVIVGFSAVGKVEEA